MNTETSPQRISIGIVGGGKAGCELLDLFRNFPECQVEYVVDLDSQAPAILQATAMGIPTFSNYEEALQKYQTDILFEVTGSDAVSHDLIRQSTEHHFSPVTHQAAYFILSAIENNTHRIQSEVITEIDSIKSKIVQSLAQIDELVQNIQTITSEMRILAINARIEAARAGEHGKGFGVVAQTMATSVDSTRELSTQIEHLNQDIQKVVEQIDTALTKLG